MWKFQVGQKVKFIKEMDPAERKISGWRVPATGAVVEIVEQFKSDWNPEIPFYRISWPGLKEITTHKFTYARQEELESLKPKRNLPDWF